MNVLEKMVKASREGRGHAALQMLLFYLDNPRYFYNFSTGFSYMLYFYTSTVESRFLRCCCFFWLSLSLRLVGSEELDPESAARLIEEFVLPLACKTREERDSVRKRIKDILRE